MINNSLELLHYSIEGSGPTLVLIHGFLESNSMWKPLKLEESYTCIKIELPGHGASKINDFEASIPFMAQCIKTTLDSIGIKEFDMIGHSLGGYVLLEFAHLFGLNGKLILLHSNFWEDEPQKKIDRQRVANIVLKNKNLFLNEALPSLFIDPKSNFTAINNLLSEAKKMEPNDIAKCSIAMSKRIDHEKTLINFGDEIRLIQGEKDKLVPLQKMLDKTSGLQNKLVVISDSGHMGQHENPTAVRNAIADLLK